jgi:hypothetical protein
MFKLLKRGRAKPSLDAIRFDTSDYHYLGEPRPGEFRAWRTPHGDGVGIYFYDLAPDLPNAESVDELAAFYDRMQSDSGGRFVEVSVMVAGGCRVVRTLASVPDEPVGRTYLGALTLPFRDFSFVIKCQCAEGQPTGLKEAVLFDRMLGAGAGIRIEKGLVELPDWNPDDPRYDAEFPNHPVARARRLLDHVAGSLVVAADVRALPRFVLPAD